MMAKLYQVGAVATPAGMQPEPRSGTAARVEKASGIEHTAIDNKNGQVSGWPTRYFGYNKNTGPQSFCFLNEIKYFWDTLIL